MAFDGGYKTRNGARDAPIVRQKQGGESLDLGVSISHNFGVIRSMKV